MQFVISCSIIVTLEIIGEDFLASREKYVQGANVIVLLSASALAAWTKTLTLTITFKPEVIEH